MFITISLYFRHKEMEIHCISSVKINILFINIQGFLLNVLQQLMFYSYSVVIKIKRLDEKECTNRTKWSIYKYNQDFQHAANVNFYNIKVFYDMSWQPECMHAQQNIRKSMPHPLNTVRQEKKTKNYKHMIWFNNLSPDWSLKINDNTNITFPKQPWFFFWWSIDLLILQNCTAWRLVWRAVDYVKVSEEQSYSKIITPEPNK